MRVLLTGAAGFIGHHMTQRLMADGHRVTILDRLDRSGNLNRLAEIGAQKCRFMFHDLRAAVNTQLAAQIGEQDWVIHMAAATHVDRSIEDPMSFELDNVVATANLLDYARLTGCKGFVYFSTDEVFGPAEILRVIDEQPGKALYVVQHSYEPRDDVKYLNTVQYKYPRKNWSSVVLWNCGHEANRKITPEL